MKIMHLRAPAIVTLLLALAVAACASPSESAAPRVFIVRHAEKAAGDDPRLTMAGERRAARLAERLAGAGIARIFSTDTRRTRDTAAPLAQRLGLTVETYDHRAPERLAARVRATGESVLIVGHSNTVRGLAEAFGVAPGPPVTDDEYDRLYVITLTEAPRVAIRRYGE